MKRLAIAALTVQLVITAGAPLAAQAAEWPDYDTVKAVIFDRAAAHKVNPYRLLCVDTKESRLNPLALNKLSGAIGIAQWLPGRNNAWDYTSAAQQGISIFNAYAIGDVNAVWYDVDMQAELFSRGLASIHWPETVSGC